MVVKLEQLEYTNKSCWSLLFLRTKLLLQRGGRNRIGRREKWPKKSWEEGEIGEKCREEGEKVR